MEFFNIIFWGVRVWIWLYFLLSIFLGGGIIIYWKREQIKKVYYKIRFPEKLLKVIIHYKSNMFKIYWRLVPDVDFFVLNNKKYLFSDKTILKDNDFFSTEKGDKTIITIEGKQYNLNDLMNIKKRGDRYPEVHYLYNCPEPINFDVKKDGIDFTAKQQLDFEQNDLMTKLLTLEENKSLIIFIAVGVGLNFIVCFVLLAKTMGWIG